MVMPRRPTRYMYVIWAAILIVAASTLWLALQAPWLGLKFSVSEDGKAVLMDGTGAPEPVQVTGLGGRDGERIGLRPADLIEEPDFFDTYAEMGDFFSQQSRLDAILRSGEVHLYWQDDKGQVGETIRVPGKRPLRDLPGVFWFQLAAGFTGLLIAVWVYLLRPQEWGARMFALTGVMFTFATTPAAIYSTRELALPGDLFRVLASLNHFGAFMFGCALVALFMTYPRLLVRPRWLLVLPAVFGAWLAADIFRWAPDQDWGSRMPVMLEMLLAILFAVVQWWQSRGRPLERAALRWFMLSTLVGCSLFVFSVYGASLTGFIPVIAQGYSFGFFLIMYAGIALGLRRYRLFDMDEWAYRVLLWIGGATSVITLDVLLILAGVEQAMSLGAALLVSGWLYFPLRQWLWQSIVNANMIRLESLLPQISGLAFASTGEAREAQWDSLLRRMFDPLELLRRGETCTRTGVKDDGLALCLPAVGGMQGRILRFSSGGRRLFSSRDAAFAETMCHLAEQVMSGREGYERGVQQERQRLARDLHDNIGARLLKLIHHLRGSPDAEIARDAMKDLRTAIAAMDAQPVPLANALADWHAEAGSRCEAAACELHWRQPEQLPAVQLAPRSKAMLESVMREIVTNALKHAAPRRVEVEIAADEQHLRAAVSNDGTIADPLTWKSGYGLRNMRGRLEELGGSLHIASAPDRVQLTAEVPLT